MAAALLAASCVPQPPMRAPEPVACRAASLPIPFTWIAANSRRDAATLTRWCSSVGRPVVVARRSRQRREASTLAVVSWNMHEDAGDLPALVDALAQGRLSGGDPVVDFVLLVQEAVRASPDVPAPAAGERQPGRISSRRGERPRPDVVETVRGLGLSLVYVPSMRNGAASAEDRGNAIISTAAPSSATAIELPFERQRRVALAVVFDTLEPLRSLRAVSAHLDTMAAITRGGPYAARARQARALADALGSREVPTVLGADLNTWYGRAETAYVELANRLIDPMPAQVATWAGPVGLRAPLDHVFVQLPPNVHISASRAPSRFGSDHYPLVVLVRFRPPGAR